MILGSEHDFKRSLERTRHLGGSLGYVERKLELGGVRQTRLSRLEPNRMETFLATDVFAIPDPVDVR